MKLIELLSGIEKRDILLPEFQREYVWNKEQSKQIFVSLFKDYPIGAFLFWKTDKPPEIKNDSINRDKVGTYQLILDGQQRLTTLYLLIKNVVPPFYVESDIRTDPRNLYFNIEAGEFKYYQPTIMKNNPVWNKVTDYFSDNNIVNIFEIVKKISKEESENMDKAQLLNKNLLKLKSILTRDFPIEFIPISASIDEAIDIFDRVNRLGTKLTDAELALTHITGKWPHARRVFKEKINELEQKNFTFDLRFIVRCLTGIVKGRANFDTIHNETKAKVMKGWKKLDQILNYIVNILPKHAYIYSTEDINTTNVLVPFIVFLSKNNKCEFRTKSSMDKAIRWLYLAHLWTRYSGQTDQKLDQDINIVMRNEDPWDELVNVIIDQRGRITLEASTLEGRGIGHPIFRMLYLLIKSKGAIDWSNGAPLYETYGSSYKIHKHHIFPTSLLYDNMFDSENHLHKKLVNEIANRAFLTAKTNIGQISNKEPEKYFPEIIDNYGKQALTNQLIPLDKHLWEIGNYEEFLNERRKLIAVEINKFINKFMVEEGKIKEKISLQEYLTSGESTILEFKSSTRWDYYQEKVNKELEFVIIKTIAAFMNTEGGTLLIGITDDEEIIGIENDLKTLKKKNLDGYELLLNDLISYYIGAEYSLYINIYFDVFQEKTVCIIDIENSSQAIFIKKQNIKEFYIKQGNSTRLLDSEETHRYIEIHWD